jgi:hypothetical protein|tara:strand:- start:606 stop:791 length:186 start_codon:yes stop_codon:yes gene_type:complete
MEVIADWEVRIQNNRKNLWLISTKDEDYLCVRVKGMFFIKDGGNRLRVKDEIISKLNLCNS